MTILGCGERTSKSSGKNNGNSKSNNSNSNSQTKGSFGMMSRDAAEKMFYVYLVADRSRVLYVGFTRQSENASYAAS
jgi:hypothetical protein